MIESNCQRHALELLHNFQMDTPSSEKTVFSSLYSQIIDISQNSPLYLIYPSEQLQSFALQVKDLSMQLTRLLNHFFSDDTDNPLKQFKVMSQKPDCVLVKRIAQLSEPMQYKLTINQIARGQRNISKRVSKSTCPFTSKTFAFTISTQSNSYDFEIPVTNTSTNEEVLTRISKSINNSAYDLEARIEQTDSALQLSIEARPSRSNLPASFMIKDHSSDGIISFYQLDTVLNPPQPSDFIINEEPHHSFATAFEIDDLFELCLIQECAEPIEIIITKNDTFITDELLQLQSTLNQLITLAKSCSRKKLELELSLFLTSYKKELEQAGFEIDGASMLQSNQDILGKSINNDNLDQLFCETASFASELLKHTQEIIINPMEYVPNKIVSYRNLFVKHFPCPYITSMYSGFLFTNFC